VAWATNWPLVDFSVYDPARGGWQTSAPVDVKGNTVTQFQNVGGIVAWATNWPLVDFSVYDPARGGWQTGPPLDV
ncbi:MAG: hypothetical protein ABSF26_31640, partial [Thermoguttaceae bacterium]